MVTLRTMMRDGTCFELKASTMVIKNVNGTLIISFDFKSQRSGTHRLFRNALVEDEGKTLVFLTSDWWRSVGIVMEHGDTVIADHMRCVKNRCS